MLSSKLSSRRLFAALFAALLLLAGCGDNGGDEPAADEPTDAATDEATEDAAAGDEVTVTGVDYSFEVPEGIEVGTRLTFENASEEEPHEMVLFRISDDEERPITELLELPDEEVEQVAQFQGVAIALPGEPAIYPEGDTTINEPGRYAIICFFPVGADAEALRAEMEARASGETEAEGPPDMGDGPPHFTQGMWAEINVS